MKLLIINPQKKIFEGEVISVTLPGYLGSFQILKNHAPIISILVPGVIKVKDINNQILTFKIENGIVEAANNIINVLID